MVENVSVIILVSEMNRLAVGSVCLAEHVLFLGLGMSNLQSLADNWMEWVYWFMNGIRR